MIQASQKVDKMGGVKNPIIMKIFADVLYEWSLPRWKERSLEAAMAAPKIMR